MFLIDYVESPLGWLKLEADTDQLVSISHIKKPTKNQLTLSFSNSSSYPRSYPPKDPSSDLRNHTDKPEFNHTHKNTLKLEQKDTAKNFSVLEITKIQLTEYFQGSRMQFDLPLAFEQGSAFQQKVWRALQQIPYGETRTYKQIAEMINNPKAVRAVGGANNKNPFSIVVPCHRVIGSKGNLVGYAGGLQRKQFLLDIESPQSV